MRAKFVRDICISLGICLPLAIILMLIGQGIIFGIFIGCFVFFVTYKCENLYEYILKNEGYENGQ